MIFSRLLAQCPQASAHPSRLDCHPRHAGVLCGLRSEKPRLHTFLLNSRKHTPKTTSARRKWNTTVSALPPGVIDERIPVTVITGFLGSGKTTLLNHILTNEHGRRIAIIENEFGEIDIDSSLVARQETVQASGDTIMVLNNGCLCCTVREDLIESLKTLYDRRAEFDHVIIETTGLANPAPIISTFHLNQDLQTKVRLDGVVTVVDSKHVGLHLNEDKEGNTNEALDQIAYADRIIINKTDLVEETALSSLESRIKNINTMATIQRGLYSKVPVDYVMGVGGFDLDRVEKQLAPEVNETHEDGHVHDSSQVHDHAHAHAHDHDHDHAHAHGHGHEHHHHHHHHDHLHDDEVKSVSLEVEGDMDLDSVNYMLGALIETRKDDLYRMKGVLSISGQERRFVFQGVHMLFDGSPDRKWAAGEKRMNKMVFIGKGLDHEDFEDAFKSCLV